MKAARFYSVGQPLVVEEIPTPRPARGEVLLRVRACGLCSSDIHIAYEGFTPTAFQPIILGHEFSGEVTELGEDVEGWEVGDRVVVCAIVSCGQCTNCVSGNQQICLQRRIILPLQKDENNQHCQIPLKRYHNLQGYSISEGLLCPVR